MVPDFGSLHSNGPHEVVDGCDGLHEVATIGYINRKCDEAAVQRLGRGSSDA